MGELRGSTPDWFRVQLHGKYPPALKRAHHGYSPEYAFGQSLGQRLISNSAITKCNGAARDLEQKQRFCAFGEIPQEG